MLLPGVPSEFQGLVSDHLLKLLPHSVKVQKNLIYKTWAIPESHIFNKLEPGLWEKLATYGTVSSLPHFSGVDIGVSVLADSLDQIKTSEEAVTLLMNQSQLGPSIWHVGEKLIEQRIHEVLTSMGKTLSTAESCTGGLIADKLTDLSGSSAYFLGSTITYATESKVKLLGVNAQTIEKHNVVSEQVAGEMAEKVRAIYNSDFSISTTGVAGPTGGSEKIPVGTVCIGIASKEKITTRIFLLKGDRRTLKIRFAEFALHCLLEELSRGSI